MTPRRRLHTAAAAAAAALASLVACEKPAPIVTVVNVGRSAYAEANVFCFEGQSAAAANCTQRQSGSTTLEVVRGQTVGIDVDKEIVDDGWFIELSDPGAAGTETDPQQSEVQTGHYFTFTAPNLPSGASLLLTVRSLNQNQEPTGEWSFTLVPR